MFVNKQTLRVNNSRIPRIKNAKFSEYYFYMNWNIQKNFQTFISVPQITDKKLLANKLRIKSSCIILDISSHSNKSARNNNTFGRADEWFCFI